MRETKTTPAKVLQHALASHYSPPDPGPAVVEGDELLSMLETLPSLSVDEHIDTMLVQMGKHHPGISLKRSDYIVIAFVDDCFGRILKETDVDYKIELFIRDLAPFVASIALRDGLTSITRAQPILEVFDQLLRECIGWSEDLGVLGEQYMVHIEEEVRTLVSGRASVAEAQVALNDVFRRERPRHEKLETRLIEKEAVLLAEQPAKHFSAQLLNREMVNKELPLFIIFMLQGAWYEFLVDLYRYHGDKTDVWQKAEKLTRALIWSLQPGAGDKRDAAMASLPDHVRTLCNALEFDTTTVVEALADLEGEYESIRAGKPSDACDFELLDTSDSLVSSALSIPEHLYKQIRALEGDQWFLYDNKHESEEKVARIKLLLNHHGTESLLFTNHNRRKIMQMSYAELAGLIDNGTVRKLTPDKKPFEWIRQILQGVVRSFQDEKRKEKEEAEAELRRQMYQAYVEERQAELQRGNAQQEKLARRKHKRALVIRQKARKKLEAAERMVGDLKTDAWVKLPVMEGTLTPCKLAAILPGNDAYIFVNRAGLKVAEYTPGQLAHLVVTENSEILDTGAEFESALANIVTGLREDKERSYDELTAFKRSA